MCKPVRFRTCTHVSCFDYDSFSQTFPHWYTKPPHERPRCPICNNAFDTLVNPHWFQKTLHFSNPSDEFVEYDIKHNRFTTFGAAQRSTSAIKLDAGPSSANAPLSGSAANPVSIDDSE